MKFLAINEDDGYMGDNSAYDHKQNLAVRRSSGAKINYSTT
jgi:hypothetical protein